MGLDLPLSKISINFNFRFSIYLGRKRWEFSGQSNLAFDVNDICVIFIRIQGIFQEPEG